MDRTGSIACVGLDPRPDLVPLRLRRDAARAPRQHQRGGGGGVRRALNRGIIEAVAGHCAAVKPQAACYEAYGAPGWAALVDTVRLAQDAGLTVIVDAKRGDIGSTSAQYRQAFFGGAPGLGEGPAPAPMAADWLTVNPYLGSDNVAEFIPDEPGVAGIFVLVKTSNPSSGELQDRRLPVAAGPDGSGDGAPADGDETVAEAVARLVHRWGAGRVGTRGLQ